MIYYSVEDELSRAVAIKLISNYCPDDTAIYPLGATFGGNGNIRKNFKKYCDLATRQYVVIITDLDRNSCAPSLRQDWLRSSGVVEPLPQRMLFCIAQTEIESWLMADTHGIVSYLKISASRLGGNIEESIVDAKEHLVKVAGSSTDPDIKVDICPKRGSKAITGLGYNRSLINFVEQVWDPDVAAGNSVTLRRAINKLRDVVIP